MTVGELNKMTLSLPPDMQVAIAIGDVLMDVNEKETGVAQVAIEKESYSLFAITPQMDGNG